VVEDGAVDLVRQRADGTEELLHVARPGEYFGELAPLLGFPRSATARGASDGAKVTGYTVAEFRKLVGPEGMRRALSMSGERPTLNKPEEVTLPVEELDTTT